MLLLCNLTNSKCSAWFCISYSPAVGKRGGGIAAAANWENSHLFNRDFADETKQASESSLLLSSLCTCTKRQNLHRRASHHQEGAFPPPNSFTQNELNIHLIFPVNNAFKKGRKGAFFLLFSVTVYNYFLLHLQTTSKAFLEVIHPRVIWMEYKPSNQKKGGWKSFLKSLAGY